MTGASEPSMTAMSVPESVVSPGVGAGEGGLSLGLKAGAACGLVLCYAAVIGLLVLLHGRQVVAGTISLAQALIPLAAFAAGAVAAGRGGQPGRRIVAGLVAGLVAGALLAGFTALAGTWNLRSVFIALSPPLVRLLTAGRGLATGSVLLVVGGVLAGGLGAAAMLLPRRPRRALLAGLSLALGFGIFQELIQAVLGSNAVFAAVGAVLYTWEGLKPSGALILFAVGAALGAMPRRPAVAGATEKRGLARRYGPALLLIVGLMLVPLAGGPYVSQVFLLIGLYLLMGMGLNLELGLAGLLDLGFVAFFATGAYVTALLTADSPLALSSYTSLPSLSFWASLPLAVLASVIVGVLFGVPVLGVKGDYLAVATLGLGEIVRIVVQSDAAAPLLGGAQGILQIPKPRIGDWELNGAVALFYLTLVAAALAGYCAFCLERSRLGRAWMALREDEDVAQALGINLVACKLLAYAFGAAFAGLAGSIFAVMVNSVFPSSFQLLMSINVLALIIVGGLGSLPGVALGAVVLIGLPEALREFGEYRYLFYGIALVLTMRLMPDGLWPAHGRRAPAAARARA